MFEVSDVTTYYWTTSQPNLEISVKSEEKDDTAIGAAPADLFLSNFLDCFKIKVFSYD